jgi:hypothetical protein
LIAQTDCTDRLAFKFTSGAFKEGLFLGNQFNGKLSCGSHDFFVRQNSMAKTELMMGFPGT